MSDIRITCGGHNLLIGDNGVVKEFNGLPIENANRKDLENIQQAINAGNFGKVKKLDTTAVKSALQEAGKWLLKRIDFVTNNKFALKAEKLNNKAIASFASNVASITGTDKKAGASDFQALGGKIYSGLVNVYDYSEKIGKLQLQVGTDLKLNALPESAHTALTTCSEAVGTVLSQAQTATEAIKTLEGITKQYVMLPISHKAGGKFSNVFINIASLFKNICNNIFRNSGNIGDVSKFVDQVISKKIFGSEAISHAALAGIVMYESGKKNPDMKVIAKCIQHMKTDFEKATKPEDKAAMAESINMAVSSLRNLKCDAKYCKDLSAAIQELAVPMMHEESTRDYLGLVNVLLNKDNPLSIYKQSLSDQVNTNVNKFVSDILKNGSHFVEGLSSSFVHSMIKELKPDADSLIRIFGSVSEPNNTMQKFLDANSKQLSLSDIKTLLNLAGDMKNTRAEAAIIQKWPFAREITKLRLELGVEILDLKNENVHLHKAVFEGKNEIKQVLGLVGKQDQLGDGINSIEKKLRNIGDKLANAGTAGLPDTEVKAIEAGLKDCDKGIPQLQKDQAGIVKECKAVEQFAGKDMNQKLNMVNEEHEQDIENLNANAKALQAAVPVMVVQPPQAPVVVAPPQLPVVPAQPIAQKKGMSTGKKVAIVGGCIALVGAIVVGIVCGVKNPEQVVAAGRLIKGYAGVAGNAVAGVAGKVWSGVKSDIAGVKRVYDFAKGVSHLKEPIKANVSSDAKVPTPAKIDYPKSLGVNPGEVEEQLTPVFVKQDGFFKRAAKRMADDYKRHDDQL